jgi:hypothetical protein
MPRLDDTLLDRVRAADPADPGEYAGRADFDAIVERLTPGPARRSRRRRVLLAVPVAALAAVGAALVVLPASAPQASEIISRASTAIDGSAGDVLYAETSVRREGTNGSYDYGTRREWVRLAPGESAPAMRSLQVSGTGDGPAGTEEVSRPGPGHGEIDKYSPAANELSTHPGAQMLPSQIFRASDILRAAGAGGNVQLAGEATIAGRPAYVLRWSQPTMAPYWPTEELTLWVDQESYAPLQFTEHEFGRDANGTQFDDTLTQTVQAFQHLPDTAANRALLDMSAHPGASLG